MRITNSMLSSNFIYDLNTNLNNMQTDQQQMATGNLINKPSDDPLGTSKVMQINTEMAQNEQYNTNITIAQQWQNVTDSTLGQVNSVLQRVNELIISAGNASYTPTQLQSVKDEINQNVGTLSQLMNTSYGGKYIFAGTSYDTQPTTTGKDASGNTTISLGTSTGINSRLSVEISQGVTVDYNVTAADIMNVPGSTGGNLQTILSNIISNLDTSSTSSLANSTTGTDLTGADETDIQAAITNISNVTAKLGAEENRMTSAQTENQAQNTSLTEALSSTDDIDYAQASMKFSQDQTVYQGALQVSASILQKSLLDYL